MIDKVDLVMGTKNDAEKLLLVYLSFFK